MEIIALLTLVYLVAGSHGAEAALVTFGVILAIHLLAGLLLCVWVALGLGSNDDPGSDGDGPGGSRRPQPPRPPEPPGSWADFERQFAEHVESLGDRDPVTSR
ncbi:MAG TPA: hypothetical protein VFX80_09680 [Solirubrobacteraceae bacterium]|nr:hypothetical protein [Solirubrobacteraceae bacterium]